MQDGRNDRQRNTYLLLIGAGVFLLAQKLLGFGIIAALAFIALGVYRVVNSGDKKGYAFFIVGVIILMANHFVVVIAIVLISLGLFYMKTKDLLREGSYLSKKSLLESIRWVREPYVLRNMSVWHIIGEIQLDLSLAIFEEPEITVVLQGIIGDIDVFVPDNVAVSAECSVAFGQAEVGPEKEAGVINKIVWQSPHYATAEHRVKLVLSYAVGDVNVKQL